MFGLTRLQRWWTQRILRRERIPTRLWRQVIESLPVLASLNRIEKHRLRKLSSLLLHEKNFVGVGGLELNQAMQVTIAAQAALLILNLGLDLYAGWSDIVVYPDAFIVPRQSLDEAGVVHESSRALEGESWGRGPVILSWADVMADSQPHTHAIGSNVVLHEFAHKLDFLNGAANGMPPLPVDIRREDWTRDFSRAYEDLYRRVERNRGTAISPYAAESPAEFFAVVTEVFFEDAERLHQRFPKVYDALRRYYQQDPRRRKAVS